MNLLREPVITSILYADDPAGTPAKKSKVVAYKPPADVAKNILLDEMNQKLWDEAMCHASKGSVAFLAQVQEIFACICCQDLVYQPVTTECKHNFCKVSKPHIPFHTLYW